MEESKVCHGFAEKGRCRFGERCRFEHVGSPPKKPRSKTKKKSHKGRREPHRDSADHIAEFFAQYPTYQYNPARSFMDEYYAMCDFFCWDKESEERELARECLRDAMVKQFNNVYGTDVDDLEAWQSLCRALELDPIPSKLRTCRTAIKGVYVNICDLLDAPMLGKPTLFSTEVELALYTKRTGKTFPRDNIHSGSLLRYLLRQILNPGSTRPRRGRR